MQHNKKTGKRFRAMQLKQKVRTIFILMSASYIVCLFVAFTAIYRDQMLETAEENLRYDVKGLAGTLSVQVEKVNGFSRILFSNKNIVAYLCGDPSEERSDYGNALRTIYDTMNAYPEVSSVYIIRNDNNFLSVTQGIISFDRQLIRSEAWRREVDQRDGAYVLRVNGDGAFVPKTSGDIICLIRNINDIDTLQTIGMMAVNFDVRVFAEATGEADNVSVSHRDYYLLDSGGEVFCHVGEGEETYEGVPPENALTSTGNFVRETLVCSYEIPGSDMSVVCVEQFVLWDNISYKILAIAVILAAIMLVMMLALDRFLAIYITEPIKKLAQTMSSVKDGWLRRVSLRTYDDEIGMLKDSYNEMLVEMNRLIEELLEKEQNMRKAEIDVLQQQIKPHFLYNTIEMIASLAVDEEEERDRVYDALETLGSFYRQFLSHGSNTVPLETELEITRKYLKLQKLRYGDIFDDAYEVDASCLQCQVPKLTIQPLVENSLYHGIRMKGEFGTIRIRIWREEDGIYLEVYDNGVGMNQDTIARVLQEERHFGLKGTLERFRYYYGTGSYRIESEVGRYTRIVLRLQEKVPEGNA